MSAHLSEVEVEALVGGGDEGEISEGAREHLRGCARCQGEVSREREEAEALTVALRRAAPRVPQMEAMIAAAMSELRERAPKASPRSMVLGAALGMLSMLVFTLLGAPKGGDLFGELGALGHNGWVLLRAADRLIGELLPGGWATLSLLALVIVAALIRPLRSLSGWDRRASGGAASLLALLGFLAVGASSGPALAWELSGSWPEPDPRVSLDVEDEPTSVALRRAAEAAGWGLVYRLPEDPPLRMHLRETPTREVLDALLGEAPIRVRHTGHLLVIEPAPSREEENSENSTINEENSTPNLLSRSQIHDRVTFGSDATVGAGEEVGDVATMGGDVLILGTAFGDVATMGGDARIEGQVMGDVVTMGGDLHVLRGARVHGQLSAMGGELVVEDARSVGSPQAEGRGAAERGDATSEEEPRGSAERRDRVRKFSRAALYHGLLFLLGLLFMGTSERRYANLRTALAGRWTRHLATGFFLALAALALGFVLTVTIIGIPAALALAVLLFVCGYLGLATVASKLGERIPIAAFKRSPVLQLAGGVLILFLLSQIPMIGPVFFITFGLIGLGAAAATRMGKDTY